MKHGSKAKPEDYAERHHIIPKCLGGSEDENNLVYLTAEAHYVAHQLLVKMNPEDPKLIYAAKRMTHGSKTTQRTNKLYGWLKKRFSIETKKQVHSEETLIKLRKPKSEEHKAKLRKPKSEEHRLKPGSERIVEKSAMKKTLKKTGSERSGKCLLGFASAVAGIYHRNTITGISGFRAVIFSQRRSLKV